MNAFFASAMLAGLCALACSNVALANGDCGINSNKPCPPPKGSTSTKEPAYRSINSNKPTTQQRAGATSPTTVKAGEEDATAAKATLTGINASDLKVKPKPESTSTKEPATKP